MPVAGAGAAGEPVGSPGVDGAAAVSTVDRVRILQGLSLMRQFVGLAWTPVRAVKPTVSTPPAARVRVFDLTTNVWSFVVLNAPFHTPATRAPSDRPKLSRQSDTAVLVGLRMVKVPIKPPFQKPASTYSDVSCGRSSAEATWMVTPVAMSSAPTPRRGTKVRGLMAGNAKATAALGKIV